MIPKQVTEIGSFVFSNCKELQKVEFEENSDLKIIGEYAFGCTSIESITIPKHITKISEGTFFNCEKFQEINFHDDCELKIIDTRSFGFTIPASFVELKDKWLKYVNSEDFDVKINEKNKQFKYFEDKIIVGKTNPESEEYENLVFARISIENLKIPPFIKRIAPFAFSECKKLESISDHNLPEFIIEKKAFILSSLNTIKLCSSKVQMTEGSLIGALNLENVDISDHNPLIMYHNDDSIIIKTDPEGDQYDDLIWARKDIIVTTIPSFIKRIGRASFAKSTLELIVIPSSVTEICKSAFYECKRLEKVEFESNSNLQIIDESAFEYTMIETIVIPKSVTKICESAFLGCFHLKLIYIEDDSKLCEIKDSAFALTDIKTISIPSGVKVLSPRAFRKCNELETIIFNNEKIDLKSIKFDDCNATLQINKNPANKNELLIDNQDEQCLNYNFDDTTAVVSHFNDKVRHVRVPKSVKNGSNECLITEISDGVFQEAWNIRSINFPSDSFLRKIGIQSFYKSSIVFVSIPPSVEEISKEAFLLCYELKRVTFAPNSQLKIIGEKAFAATKIRKFKVPKHVSEIKEGTFRNCERLKEFTFETDSELKKICKYVFYNTEILIIEIPASVVELEEGWLFGSDFGLTMVNKNNPIYKNIEQKRYIVGKTDPQSEEYDLLVSGSSSNDIPPFVKRICDSSFSGLLINEIKIPQHVTEIDKFTFRFCPGLSKVEFAENSELRIIGSNAFELTRIETIVIPPHVTEIQSFAFSGCGLLKQVTFSDESELRIIDKGAFECCSIKRIKIPQDVKEIHENVFAKCDLEEIEFSDNSELEIIEDTAFEYTLIQYIVIQPTVTKMSENSFQNCNNLSVIFIDENSDLKSMKLIDCNATFESKKNLPTINCLSFDFDEENQTAKVTGINSNVDPDYILIPRTVKHNEHEFLVTEISEGSFEGSKSLKIVFFSPDTQVRVIGKNSFASSTIKRIIIPSTVDEICENAFFNCERLEKVSFPKNSQLKIISANSFSSTAIESIAIPSNVTEICENAFSKCNDLQTVVFNENSNLNVIGKNAFRDSKI